MDFNNLYIPGNGNEFPLQVSYLLMYFTCDVNMTSLSRSWHWWAATASVACVARLGAVADWWRSWPMANKLACLCFWQWWTFWTYLVRVNLFSLKLMNSMFHTTLDAVGNILGVITEVWNLMFDFHKVAQVHYLGQVDMFFMCVKWSSCLQQCKNYF